MKHPIECHEYIPDFSPEEVFAVASHRDALPSSIGGFQLEVEDELIRKGTLFGISLDTGVGKYEVAARVTEFRPSEYVLIQGRDRGLGDASIWLNLADHAPVNGTRIDYGLHVAYGAKIPWLARPLVTGYLKDKVLPQYSSLYRSNILERLQIVQFEADQAA